MTTEKQIRANIENAILGGVKTEDGKDISRFNAIKHGFFSQLITKHDILNHQDFVDEMYNLISPTNIYQTQLLEILLSNFLSYRRISLFESNLIDNELEKAINTQDEHLPIDFAATSYQIKFRSCFIDELIKFQRYKITALNSILKTKNALDNSNHE